MRISKKEFYKLLIESKEFTSELGTISLYSGQLERELVELIRLHDPNINSQKKTLGTLINECEKLKLLSYNLHIALDTVNKQRSYFIHNVYSLLSEYIDETILESENLVDMDVLTYIERALILKQNLEHLSDVVYKLRITKC
jgi:hypothetical protein